MGQMKGEVVFKKIERKLLTGAYKLEDERVQRQRSGRDVGK